MEKRRFVTVDGNEATANIAHLCNEVMAIYPITPSTGLGELPDAWAAAGRKNAFGTVPVVVEMQSEAGAVRGRPRLAPGRGADDHLHRLPGPVVDDPEHVQDRRGIDRDGLPRHRPRRGHPRPVDLRRPQRRDGVPHDGLCVAFVGVGAGIAGHGPDRPGGDAGKPHPLPPLFRRLPHFPRGEQDRATDRGRRPRDDRRGVGAGAPPPRALAGAAGAAGDRAESQRLLPSPRGLQPLLRQGRRAGAEGDGQVRQAGRPAISFVRLRRRRGRRPGRRRHGLGLRRRRGDGRKADGPGAEDRHDSRASLPPLRRRRASGGVAEVGEEDRRAGPHEGAGRRRRAALSGRGHGAGGVLAGRAAECDRRAIRPVVEGIHARAGRRRLQRVGQAAAETALHRRHSRRRHPLEPRLRSALHDGNGRRHPRGLLRPGERRHRERQPQLGEDHRREHAAALAGLLRLRLAEGGLGDHLARPLQSTADQGIVPRPPGEFRRLPPGPVPRTGSTCCRWPSRGRLSC